MIDTGNLFQWWKQKNNKWYNTFKSLSKSSHESLLSKSICSPEHQSVSVDLMDFCAVCGFVPLWNIHSVWSNDKNLSNNMVKKKKKKKKLNNPSTAIKLKMNTIRALERSRFMKLRFLLKYYRVQKFCMNASDWANSIMMHSGRLSHAKLMHIWGVSSRCRATQSLFLLSGPDASIKVS